MHLFFDPAVASIARNDLSEVERLEWRPGSAPRANRVFVLPDTSLAHPEYTPELRLVRADLSEEDPPDAQLASRDRREVPDRATGTGSTATALQN
jgi:hypothetical protein